MPSFSAWVSSGKTTSAIAVVTFSKVEKATMWSAAARADFQASVSGKSRRGSTPKSSRAFNSPASSAARISSVDFPADPPFSVVSMVNGGLVRPGPASGRQPASRRPRALAVSGISSKPDPSLPARSRAAARSSRAAVGPTPSRAMRSPQTITTDAALASISAISEPPPCPFARRMATSSERKRPVPPGA